MEHEPRVQLPSKGPSSTEISDNLDETFRKLSGQLSTICSPFPKDIVNSSAHAKVFPYEGES